MKNGQIKPVVKNFKMTQNSKAKEYLMQAYTLVGNASAQLCLASGLWAKIGVRIWNSRDNLLFEIEQQQWPLYKL